MSIERPRTALELIAFAAWVNVPVDKLPPEMLGHTNQATMEAWKRVVDAVQTATRNPCAGIFDHKWLDPECVHGGCQSLSLPKNWPEAAKDD